MNFLDRVCHLALVVGIIDHKTEYGAQALSGKIKSGLMLIWGCLDNTTKWHQNKSLESRIDNHQHYRTTTNNESTTQWQ
jgi:hypothetical protein